MWSLQSLEDSDTIYRLTTDKDYIVGRKDCDIVIENDKSISRKHAVLRVTHLESNLGKPNCLPTLHVKDLSKFGTFVDHVQIKEKDDFVDGNIIKFGGLNSKWKLQYQRLIVATSSLDSSSKREIKNLLCKLGGHFVSDWVEETTHLVTSKLLLTVKAVCALLSAKPIVTPLYFNELIKSIQNKNQPPSIDRFLPPLNETSLQDSQVDFSCLECRKSLFTGKKFLFSSPEQYKKLSLPIRLGGGEAIFLTVPPSSHLLLRSGVCVVSSPPESTNQSSSWLQEALNILKKNSKRPISESEIGLAAIHNSTEKYCNSAIDAYNNQLSVQIMTQTQLRDVMAPDSQNSLFSSTMNRNLDIFNDEQSPSKIPETRLPASTNTYTRSSLIDRKRGLEDEEFSSPASKIARVDSQMDIDDIDDDLCSQAMAKHEMISERSVEIIEHEKKRIEVLNLDNYSASMSHQSQLPIPQSNGHLPPPSLSSDDENISDDWISKKLPINVDGENEDKKSYVTIETKPLLRKDVIQQNSNFVLEENQILNFKKFKKVHPFRGTIERPTIINTNNNNNDAILLDEDENDDRLTTDQGTQEEEEDLFDWTPKTVRRS